MKCSNKMFSRNSLWGFVLIVIMLFLVSYTVAQSKTVVIPLFDSESATPQTQYFTVGGEAFVPGSNVSYTNTYVCGGAYVDSAGGHALVASVHLPHGAEVTEFEVFFDDTSSNDMSVTLYGQSLTSCASSIMAVVESSGTAGYYSGIDSSISASIIDNKLRSYHVYAHSTGWSSDLRIKGAVITYTIN